MRKSFMNIKHFVDSNVRYKANTTNEPISDDLVLVERQFEDLRQLCLDAEKRISTLLQSISTSTLGAYTQNVQASLSNLSQLTQVTSPAQASSAGDQQNSANQNYANNSSVLTSNNDNNVRPHAAGNQLHAPDGGQSSEDTKFDITKHHKKLPIVGFLKFLVKSSHKLRQDSLLATTMTHCSHLQAQLTKLYMSFERTIEAQCLKPIQHVLETDVPNIIRLRKSFIKAHNDLESVRARYNGASQKQQQHQLTAHFTSTSYTITQSNAHQANVNKLDSLKKELDDSETRFEQAKDIYAIELYTFVCRETELVELFIKFYQHHAEYQAQASALIQNSLPSLSNTLSTTPRRVVFGTPLSEHLRCTSRNVSVVVELCVHLLYSNALNEEGLFRVPGSSIKIKKLKSAINAWFVTLATHNELSENQDQTEINSRQYKTTTASTQQSTLLAVYSLFKDIVGQRPPNQLTAPVGGEAANHNNQIVSTVKDESAQASAADYSTCDRVSERLVFDVHTVAGLLKLYLRELPEPLLGDALYERWADACASHSNTGRGEPIDDLKRVVEQLPKANYDNLRLLTRFLHLLTCHHEQNKMTATNLAITMAPSLIWIPKNRQHQLEPADNYHQGVDESQTLTMQMSNMGISASLHALIVENLINHGEQLFPGNIDFAIPCLDAEPMSHMSYGRRLRTLANDRPIESNSPTGSSTESTSSFSSNSNMSSSKKSGSIEGLAPECDTAPSPKPVRPTRPQSVHINRELDKRSTKPPVPPAPAIRSHSKQGSDSATLVRRLASRKPPAPPVPVPAPCASLGQSKNIAVAPLELSGHEVSKDDYAPTKENQQIPQPTSLRGTGTLTPNGGGLNVQTRPCVPPPARPHASNQSEKRDRSQSSAISASKLKNECVDVGKSPGSFQDGLDDIKALGMIDDDMSEHTSPVVSLDGVSGDDSSFDNQSWTEYDSDKDKNQLNIDSSGEETTSAPRPKDGSNRSLEPRNSKAIKSSRTESEPTPETKFADNNNLGLLAPPKPPRSTSPKINAASVTQSTPL